MIYSRVIKKVVAALCYLLLVLQRKIVIILLSCFEKKIFSFQQLCFTLNEWLPSCQHTHPLKLNIIDYWFCNVRDRQESIVPLQHQIPSNWVRWHYRDRVFNGCNTIYWIWPLNNWIIGTSDMLPTGLRILPNVTALSTNRYKCCIAQWVTYIYYYLDCKSSVKKEICLIFLSAWWRFTIVPTVFLFFSKYHVHESCVAITLTDSCICLRRTHGLNITNCWC